MAVKTVLAFLLLVTQQAQSWRQGLSICYTMSTVE